MYHWQKLQFQHEETTVTFSGHLWGKVIKPNGKEKGNGKGKQSNKFRFQNHPFKLIVSILVNWHNFIAIIHYCKRVFVIIFFSNNFFFQCRQRPNRKTTTITQIVVWETAEVIWYLGGPPGGHPETYRTITVLLNQ